MLDYAYECWNCERQGAYFTVRRACPSVHQVLGGLICITRYASDRLANRSRTHGAGGKLPTSTGSERAHAAYLASCASCAYFAANLSRSAFNVDVYVRAGHY